MTNTSIKNKEENKVQSICTKKYSLQWFLRSLCNTYRYLHIFVGYKPVTVSEILCCPPTHVFLLDANVSVLFASNAASS